MLIVLNVFRSALSEQQSSTVASYFSIFSISLTFKTFLDIFSAIIKALEILT